MGSGVSGLYSNTHGSSGGDGEEKSSGPVNGKNYNNAGSESVKTVTRVFLSGEHKVPHNGAPDSVIRNYHKGSLFSERYYGSDGKPYLDIDYTNHGNAKRHPYVPHEHKIWFDENGKMKRGKDEKI